MKTTSKFFCSWNHKSLKQNGFFSLHCRSVLLLIDRNGDSEISVKELSAWTQKSMRTFYRQEADGRLSSLDSDKDSKVSWGEYVKGAENRDGKHCDTSYAPQAPMSPCNNDDAMFLFLCISQFSLFLRTLPFYPPIYRINSRFAAGAHY